MDQQSASESLRLFEETWEEARAAFLSAQDEFADKLANARQTLRSCAGNVEKHKANLEQLTESAKARFGEIRSLIESGGQSADLEERVKSLEAALADKDVALQAAADAVTALEKRASEADARASALQGELNASKDAAAATTRELEEARRALENAQSADASTGERVKELEAAEAALRAELEAAKAAVESAKSDAESANARAAESVAGAEATAKELAQARKRLDEAETALTKLEQGNVPLQAELSSLRKELDAAIGARVGLQEEIDRLLGEVKKAEAGTKSVEERFEEKRQEFAAALEAERKRADLAEQKLKDEMAKGTKASLAAQLAEAIQEAEEAKEELRTLRSIHGSAGVPAASVAADETTATATARAAKDELKALADATKRLKGQKRSIGELMVESGLLDKDQVAQAVDEQRKRPQTHLGAIFIEKSWCSEEAVAQALAYQCGAKYTALGDGAVDATAAALINERLANQHACIPISATEDALTLAMANPMDLVAIEDVERATGRKVDVVVSTATEIKTAIGKYFWEP